MLILLEFSKNVFYWYLLYQFLLTILLEIQPIFSLDYLIYFPAESLIAFSFSIYNTRIYKEKEWDSHKLSHKSLLSHIASWNVCVHLTYTLRHNIPFIKLSFHLLIPCQIRKDNNRSYIVSAFNLESDFKEQKWPQEDVSNERKRIITPLVSFVGIGCYFHERPTEQ